VDPQKPIEPQRPILQEERSPAKAAEIVGTGALLGLYLSFMAIKFVLAPRLASRPFGDRICQRRWLSREPVPESWDRPPNIEKEAFLFQNALRSNLISRGEYRYLRARYLVTADFIFGMLFPLLLVLIYFAIGEKHDLQILLLSTLLTTLLTTFAIERRHQFRSRYRSLIVANEKARREGEAKASPKSAGSPSGQAASSPEQRVSREELLRIIGQLASVLGENPAVRPEAPGREGE